MQERTDADRGGGGGGGGPTELCEAGPWEAGVGVTVERARASLESYLLPKGEQYQIYGIIP